MGEKISKAALITGCSTGIGRATAQLMAEKGMNVYATARNPETLADLAEAGCKTLALDVCDEDSMVAAVGQVVDAEGAVGILVNNAGYSLTLPIEEAPMDEVRRLFETNVFGLSRMSQLVLPQMRAQRYGRIINLSSLGGKLTFPGMGYYHATKYAVEAISDALRFEARPFGIKVAVIEPGIIKTAFGETAATEPPSEDGPYSSFKSGVDAKMTDAYEGTLSAFATGPETVARVILKAVESRNPRPRYVVTFGAKSMRIVRTLLPDRAFDTVLRTQFPHPKPAAEAEVAESG